MPKRKSGGASKTSKQPGGSKKQRRTSRDPAKATELEPAELDQVVGGTGKVSAGVAHGTDMRPWTVTHGKG